MAYQVSIFLENKIGHFERVTGVLAEQNISIKTMTLTHTASGWGILNLIVPNPEKAVAELGNNGLSAALREILVLEMDDKPGGLDAILKKLAKAEINFTNAYGRMLRDGEKAFLVVDVDDIEHVQDKLKSVGLKPVADDLVYGNVN